MEQTMDAPNRYPYDFFGRHPARWGETLEWIVSCTSSASEWTPASLDAVGQGLADAFTVGHKLEIEIAGETLWLRAEWVDEESEHFFRHVESAMDAIHDAVGLQRVVMTSAEVLAPEEQEHWSAERRWPDFGEGSVEPADWTVEGLAFQARIDLTAFPKLDAAIATKRAQTPPPEADELGFRPIPRPAWLDRADHYNANAPGLFQATPVGGMGWRSRTQGPWASAAKEVFIDVDGNIGVFERPADERLIIHASVSGHRMLALRTSKKRSEVLEFRHGDSVGEVVIASTPKHIDPNRKIWDAAYLDTDDWVVVLASCSQPKEVESLELWRRSSAGFVRVDDLKCGAVRVKSSGACAVVEQDNGSYAVFGRVGAQLVSLGRVKPKAKEQWLCVGPDAELVALNRERECYELVNHEPIRSQHAPRVRPTDSAVLAELQGPGTWPEVPDTVPTGWTEARSANGRCWTLTGEDLVIATEEDVDIFELPSGDFSGWSLALDGDRALFAMGPEGLHEFQRRTQTWRKCLSESGRPHYLAIGGEEFIALSASSGTKIYSRDAGESAPVATLEQETWGLGSQTLLGADGHLYSVSSQDGQLRVERGECVHAPGRRLEGLPVTGRVENGRGYAFVRTSIHGQGAYCWRLGPDDVAAFS
ncbi:MAG: hypothetical protein KUG77_14575 [Nannocystaceae bacterium]|nr:hypothetical protein [Nannocystaceae bacterium]